MTAAQTTRPETAVDDIVYTPEAERAYGKGFEDGYNECESELLADNARLRTALELMLRGMAGMPDAGNAVAVARTALAQSDKP